MATKKMAMGGLGSVGKAAVAAAQKAAPAAARAAAQAVPMNARQAMAGRGNTVANAVRGVMAGAPKSGPTPTGMKSGGFVKSADGIAKKGKTKATQVKMAKGGSTKKYC